MLARSRAPRQAFPDKPAGKSKDEEAVASVLRGGERRMNRVRRRWKHGSRRASGLPQLVGSEELPISRRSCDAVEVKVLALVDGSCGVGGHSGVISAGHVRENGLRAQSNEPDEHLCGSG